MTGRYGSPLVRFGGRIQAPLLQIFALYVVTHGHYSPGGGFQAGAALAGAYLLGRIAEGMGPRGRRGLTTHRATVLAVIGVGIYAFLGIGPLLLGGNFLDYAAFDALPLPLPGGAATRALCTVLVEVGVTLAVMGVLVGLFDDLLGRLPEGS